MKNVIVVIGPGLIGQAIAGPQISDYQERLDVIDI